MKKLYLLIILFTFCFWAFSETDEPEEIDYLLFMPDSGRGFVNETRARTQLDSLAKYLLEKNISAGQIFVYGYAADAVNEIEPVSLSVERALFVISELRRRGVPHELFSDPVGYGPVNLWGSNVSENDRSPNRRVRILLDGTVLTPAVLKAEAPPQVIIAEPPQEVIPPAQVPETANAAPVNQNVFPASQAAAGIVSGNSASSSGKKFPWFLLLLLLLLIALILFLIFKRRKKPVYAVEQKVSAVAAAVAAGIPAADIKPAVPVILPAAPFVAAAPIAAIAVPVIAAAPAAVSETIVNLDEEIRFRAWELFIQHGCQNGNEEGDWYAALSDVRSKYEADGWRVYMEAGSWQACKSV